MTSEIVAMIEQVDAWRLGHRYARCHIEAAAAAIREHALLDALEAIGGSSKRWRKDCGVLRDSALSAYEGKEKG